MSMSGNVAKLVHRLSKDLAVNRMTTGAVTDISFRRPGNISPRTATVRYSYKAAHDDELDLEVDDLIDVLEEAETGWMKGKLRNTGRVGLFPTNFVHFHEDATGNNDTSKLDDVKKKSSDMMASGDFSPEDPVPRSSVVLDSPKGRVNSSSSINAGKKNTIDQNESVSRARVLFTYSPKHEDELELREVGQIVVIVSKSSEDPGWLVAQIDGKRGLIPDNFVEVLKPEAQETLKMQSAPNVPVKPAPKITSGTNRRATTSSVFAQMHSTLADKFTKPPKQFSSKATKPEEVQIGDGRTCDRLSHVTATRPKQPNKRPPSTVFMRRKSNDSLLDDNVMTAECGRISPVPSVSTLDVPVQQSSIAPSMKSTKVQLSSSPKSNDKSGEFVTRAEYNHLLEQFEELQAEMNKYRLEITQKLASLEVKIAKEA